MVPTSQPGGRAPLLLGLTFTQCFIAMVLVMLRAHTARMHAGKVRWDFILVVVALVFAVASQITILLECMHGIGKHLYQVPLDDLWWSLRMIWIGVSVGTVGITIAKLSIIALLLQVTPYVQPYRRIALYCVGVINVAVSAVQIILIWMQCTPISHLWYKLSPGTCDLASLSFNYSYFQGAVSTATDIGLAAYPTFVIWRLQMPYRTKVAFCVLMAGGILPAAMGVVRIINTERLIHPTDPTYFLPPFLLASATEMWFVIILGSVPPLRPLFKRILPSRFKTSSADCTEGQSYLVKTVGNANVRIIVNPMDEDDVPEIEIYDLPELTAGTRN